MRLDVAISGAGVISPLGHSPAALFEALCAQESAVAPVSAFDTSPFPCHSAATVKNFRARDWVKNRKNLKLMSPAVRFGLGAARAAFQDAGALEIDPERRGLFVGAATAFGETRDLLPALKAAFEGTEFSSQRFGEAGQSLINPLWLIRGLSNNTLGFATAEMDFRGINQNYCNSAVGGLQAVGEAAWALMEGRAELLLAGGADSAVNEAHFTGFGRLGLLSPGGLARPFDQRQDGFIPGEGAAFFALERLEEAQARGAKVLGRVVAYKEGCAGQSLLTGSSAVIAQGIQGAMEEAGWSDLDLFCAHGNATAFDLTEAEALYLVFGESCPPISSNKAQLGHAVAASGPFSLICALEAARTGQIPGIPQLSEPIRPWLNISGVLREAPLHRILIHAAGLGGQSCLLALEFDR